MRRSKHFTRQGAQCNTFYISTVFLDLLSTMRVGGLVSFDRTQAIQNALTCPGMNEIEPDNMPLGRSNG
jgi:hypothetical protein